MTVRGTLDIGGRYEVGGSTLTSVIGDLLVKTGGELDNQGSVNYSGTYTNDGTLTGNAPMQN